jgi:predicted Zn-dependent peptidase
MTEFRKFQLDNGLRILIHEDSSTPLVAMNLLYMVGSRNEDPTQTGLAHLFEHLMFGGSEIFLNSIHRFSLQAGKTMPTQIMILPITI